MTSYRRYIAEPNDFGFPPSQNEILDRLFDPDVHHWIKREIEHLTRAYRTAIHYGKAHPAQCSAWRAERGLRDPKFDHDARFVNRIHLFAGARHQSNLDDREIGYTQRYLGYVALRPIKALPFDYAKPGEKNWWYLRHTSIAMLAVPPYMARPRYHVITTYAGPADGVLPFRATPFFVPPSSYGDIQEGKEEGGSPCMHAALYVALLLKAGLFHCRPISSIEMVTLLWQMDHDPRWKSTDWQREYGGMRRPLRLRESDGKILGGQWSFYDWTKQPLTTGQALSVLKHPEVRSGGVVETITASQSYRLGIHSHAIYSRSEDERRKSTQLEALRAITDYLTNGIPVIVEVKSRPPQGETDMPPAADAHAVLITGMHLMTDPDDPHGPIPDDDDDSQLRVDVKELPSRLVTHDPYLGPYRVISSEYLLDRAMTNFTGEDRKGTPIFEPLKPEDGVRFLAVLPCLARLGIEDVRDKTRRLLGSQGEYSASVANKRDYMQRHLRCQERVTALAFGSVRERRRFEPGAAVEELPVLLRAIADGTWRQTSSEWLPEDTLDPSLAWLKTPAEARFVTRLVRSRQLIERYLRRKEAGEEEDLQRLRNALARPGTLRRLLAGEAAKNLKELLKGRSTPSELRHEQRYQLRSCLKPDGQDLAEARYNLQKFVDQCQSNYEIRIDDYLRSHRSAELHDLRSAAAGLETPAPDTSRRSQDRIDPIPLHWWCVEVREPRMPARALLANRQQGAPPLGVTPPLAVYCWPVSLSLEDQDQMESDYGSANRLPRPEERGFQAPVRIDYLAGDRARLEIRSYLPALPDTPAPERLISREFAGWRPHDG